MMPNTTSARHKFRLLAILTTLIALAIAFLFYWLEYRVRVPDLPQPSLKQLAAKHNMDIGNFAIQTRLHEKPYRAILTSQFNLALIDNTPNWYFTDGGLRPSEDSFDFRQMDEVVGFAESNDMAIQAHHLLWGEEKWLPPWLKDGNYGPEQLHELIRHHISTVAGRYAGRIQEWTVVNEVFSRSMRVNGLSDWWTENTGGHDYLDLAFKTAHEADPAAALIINDFNNERQNPISDATYDYVKQALARGVPIHGLGMQMHIDGTDPPSKEEVISNMQRFGDLGLRVYVTEFDVNMNDVEGDAGHKNQLQADIYYDMARACIEAAACKSFAILGVSDIETWYNYIGLDDPRPLPFDERYQPKPAFFALRNALSQP